MLTGLLMSALAFVPAEAEATDFGFGFQTQSIPSHGDDNRAAMTGALSGWFDLGQLSIQPFFGLYGTEDETDFGLGANFRFLVVGDSNAGFHIGGAIGIGEDDDGNRDDDMYIAPGFLVGIQFRFNEVIQCTVDGGLMLVIEDDDNRNDDGDDIDLSLGTNGPLASFSIHYMF